MYIPFLAKQKTNAWQLAVLPCVFGMLFYFAGRYNFGHMLASIALLSAAVTLLAFALTGGLRACAIGMDASLICMAVRTGPSYLLLTAALSAFILVFLMRVLLPKKLRTPEAKANFKSFFWIAGIGVLLFILVIISSLIFLLVPSQ